LKIAERSFCGVLKDLSSLTYSKIHNRLSKLPSITNYHWLVVLLLTASEELAERTGVKTTHIFQLSYCSHIISVLVAHPTERWQEHANCTVARTSVVENNSERKEKLLQTGYCNKAYV
jgi:hypothetical protein